MYPKINESKRKKLTCAENPQKTQTKNDTMCMQSFYKKSIAKICLYDSKTSDRGQEVNVRDSEIDQSKSHLPIPLVDLLDH